jgi:hypothetical protein
MYDTVEQERTSHGNRNEIHHETSQRTLWKIEERKTAHRETVTWTG